MCLVLLIKAASKGRSSVKAACPLPLCAADFCVLWPSGLWPGLCSLDLLFWFNAWTFEYLCCDPELCLDYAFCPKCLLIRGHQPEPLISSLQSISFLASALRSSGGGLNLVICLLKHSCPTFPWGSRQFAVIVKNVSTLNQNKIPKHSLPTPLKVPAIQISVRVMANRQQLLKMSKEGTSPISSGNPFQKAGALRGKAQFLVDARWTTWSGWKANRCLSDYHSWVTGAYSPDLQIRLFRMDYEYFSIASIMSWY